MSKPFSIILLLHISMLIWQAILGLLTGGFIEIGIGSYAAIESAVTISRFFGISS